MARTTSSGKRLDTARYRTIRFRAELSFGVDVEGDGVAGEDGRGGSGEDTRDDD